MTMAVLDSNILMDMLNGVPEALVEISYYSESYISSITWSEVLVGCMMGDQANPPTAANPVGQVALFQTVLAGAKINVVQTDPVIMLKAAQIRAAGLAETPKRKIKLTDAIIGATAQALGLMVVTRNPRDFGANAVRIPYQIDAFGTVTKVLPPP